MDRSYGSMRCSANRFYSISGDFKMNACLPNFKSAVPFEVQSKLKELAELASFDDIVTSSLKFAGYGGQSMNEIEGNYKSGWMPKQDGGFEISEYYSSAPYDSTFTDKQKDFLEDQVKQCFDAYISDYRREDADIPYEEWTEEQREQFNEYENEWFSAGALLQLQMFVDGYGEYSREPEKTVTIRLSINYKDAPYFRENGAEDIKQVVLSIDEFMAQSNEDILKEFNV
jgi:hypothetical protein